MLLISLADSVCGSLTAGEQSGEVHEMATMRIAQVAPLYESVPPKLYGGTERVVSNLTEELVSRGHDVTLFGGRIVRDTEASIGGDVTAFTGSLWMVMIFGFPLLLLAGVVALIIWLVRLASRRAVPAAA